MGKKITKELEVTNDCAKRREKLVGEFKDFTTNEGPFIKDVPL